MPEARGRLELTWTNKDRRLLAHDDVTYEWVDPEDWRVSEIRLLDEISTHGEVGAHDESGGNLLIRGDSLHALASLAGVPEQADRYARQVKLCYIDLPFNTGETFSDYDDNLEHSVWLTMLRDRLVQIRRLLAEDGSVWVHLDDSEQHRARCVLDEVFGADNFVATFLWQKLYARKSNSHVSSNHDVIHVYAAGPDFRLRMLPPSDEQLKRYKNRDDDPRGPWQSVAFHVRTDNPERRGEYRYKVTLPSGREVGPPKGRHWNGKRERYERLLAEDRLWFGADGDSRPRYKHFLDRDAVGLVPFTIWPRDEVGDNEESKREIHALVPEVDDVFATPKPERLMERIIHLGSVEGDLVLDCFAGSGTTAAVAHKMGRRWVAVEMSSDTVATYTRPRLVKVVDGEDPGGVTEQCGWQGGGGFTELAVAGSMFADVDGTVVLAEQATGGQLAAMVAAQLDFAHAPDGPFAGTRGRARLVVLDGMLTTELAEHLVGLLEADQTLVVVAATLAPGVDEHLRSVRPGSRARKIPRDLARTGKLPSRLVRLTDTRLAEAAR